MRHHKFLAGFLLLVMLTACSSGKPLLDKMSKSFESLTAPKAQPASPTPPPPPSPKAAQDQVNLPPEARPLKESVLLPDPNKTTIALLLPLSGPHATIGRDLQDAALLALDDVKNDALRMLPIDTAGTQEGAIRAANEAVSAQADIVIGPVFGSEAAVVGPIVRQHDIPVVTFSNNTDLTKQELFVFGFMPQQQIDRVLRFAVAQGVRDFYVIAPSDAFGDASIATLEGQKGREEITLHQVQRYNPATNQGMVEAARQIAQHVLAQKKQDSTPRQRGLLIPEGGTKLLELSKLLAGFGLNANDVRLLGSGQWDDVNLGNYKRLYGGWFATASPTQRSLFQKHFEETYNYNPIRIASIAYDAVALVGFLSQQSGKRFTTSALINQRGFAGVDGAFRFTPERIAERSLAVLEVIPNGFEIVDEAPKVLPSYSGQ